MIIELIPAADAERMFPSALPYMLAPPSRYLIPPPPHPDLEYIKAKSEAFWRDFNRAIAAAPAPRSPPPLTPAPSDG